MTIGTITNNINVVENIKSAATRIKTTAVRCLSNTYTVEVFNTVRPYAKAAAILAISTIFFKVLASSWTFSLLAESGNHLLSAMISFTTGGVTGCISTSFNSKIEKLTIIGIGLLNQILIPAYIPMYSLSTITTIFFNMIGVSLFRKDSHSL